MIVGKYPLQITEEQTVMMPFGAEILSVQFQKDHNQRDNLQLWALIDETSTHMQHRKIRLMGTGPAHAVESRPGKFLGTVQEAGGALIWHIFDATQQV